MEFYFNFDSRSGKPLVFIDGERMEVTSFSVNYSARETIADTNAVTFCGYFGQDPSRSFRVNLKTNEIQETTDGIWRPNPYDEVDVYASYAKVFLPAQVSELAVGDIFRKGPSWYKVTKIERDPFRLCIEPYIRKVGKKNV